MPSISTAIEHLESVPFARDTMYICMPYAVRNAHMAR